MALLAAKGIPMLFEGEELGEDFTLPGNGLGRIGLLRPISWDYFYDDPGRRLVRVVRTMLRLGRTRDELRRGNHWYYADPDAYQNRGVMIFKRSPGSSATVVAVNLTDADVGVGFTFPAAGHWSESLTGNDTLDVSASERVSLSLPSNFGQVPRLTTSCCRDRVKAVMVPTRHADRHAA
jgi:1,4-alpha-glucan branching enzyme